MYDLKLGFLNFKRSSMKCMQNMKLTEGSWSTYWSDSVMAKKAAGAYPGWASRPLNKSLWQQICKWELFLNQGNIGRRKERNGLRLSNAVPKIMWVSYLQLP